MARPELLSSRNFVRRLRQCLYVGAHPVSHLQCASVIRESGLARDPATPLKYLGEHLSRSLGITQRRAALMGHYAAFQRLLAPNLRRQLGDGIEVWRKDVEGADKPLSIVLEPARLAPMEGGLQLRFAFKSDLFVLTFLLAPGSAFGVDCDTVMFIGGMQGRVAAREKMREASRANCEISPAAMLFLTAQNIAKVVGVDQLIAVSESHHISTGYSPTKILFDYQRFWTEAGGERAGDYYRLPLRSVQKPLSEIGLSHRARTRKKREAKVSISDAIERRLRQIIVPERVSVRVPLLELTSELCLSR